MNEIKNDEEIIKSNFLNKINISENIHPSEINFTKKIYEEYIKYKNIISISKNNIHPKIFLIYKNIIKWIKIIITNSNFKLIQFTSIDKTNTKNSYIHQHSCSRTIEGTNLKGSANFSQKYKKKIEDEYYTDNKIIEILSEFNTNNHDLFIKYIQEGPPESFRLLSWYILNNINKYKTDINNTDLYGKYLVNNLDVSKMDIIERDVKRTFNYIYGSKKKKYELGLFNILKAFWSIDNEIGYCQGMNLISSFLLIVSNCNENFAFEIMISIFSNTYKNDNFCFRGLFTDDFPLLLFCNFIFNNLLNKYLLQLKSHLDYYDIINEVWVIKWFQTVFTIILPISWCKRLWDNIFAENIFFMVKFAIALCTKLSHIILKKKDQQDIMDFFLDLQKMSLNSKNIFLENITNIDELINKSHLIDISIEEFLDSNINIAKKMKKTIIYKDALNSNSTQKKKIFEKITDSKNIKTKKIYSRPRNILKNSKICFRRVNRKIDEIDRFNLTTSFSNVVKLNYNLKNIYFRKYLDSKINKFSTVSLVECCKKQLNSAKKKCFPKILEINPTKRLIKHKNDININSSTNRLLNLDKNFKRFKNEPKTEYNFFKKKRTLFSESENEDHINKFRNLMKKNIKKANQSNNQSNLNNNRMSKYIKIINKKKNNDILAIRNFLANNNCSETIKK